MHTLTVFAVGSKVNYGPDDSLSGEIDRVNIGRDGRIEYEIAYWHNGERKTCWLHSELVKPHEKVQKIRLGFSGDIFRE